MTIQEIIEWENRGRPIDHNGQIKWLCAGFVQRDALLKGMILVSSSPEGGADMRTNQKDSLEIKEVWITAIPLAESKLA